MTYSTNTISTLILMLLFAVAGCAIDNEIGNTETTVDHKQKIAHSDDETYVERITAMPTTFCRTDIL